MGKKKGKDERRIGAFHRRVQDMLDHDAKGNDDKAEKARRDVDRLKELVPTDVVERLLGSS